MAGWGAWLLIPASVGNTWDLSGSLYVSIVATGLFAGFFCGASLALQAFLYEGRYRKALSLFLYGTVAGLSLTIFFETIYAMTTVFLPPILEKLLLQIAIASAIAVALGSLRGSLVYAVKLFLGLLPALFCSSTIAEKFLLKNSHYAAVFILTGLFAGIAAALAQELLKSAWLDEDDDKKFPARYYLDSKFFTAGYSNECELSLPKQSENDTKELFRIVFDNGVHQLESLGETQLCVNKKNLRFRILEDGDLIEAGNKKFIYRNIFSRIREALPSPSN